MVYIIIIFAIIITGISSIVDEGSFFSKLSLSALVAAVALVLLRWVMGWALMTLLAKISIATAILAALVAIIMKMAK